MNLQTHKKSHVSRAFTIVEMLVVIGILVVVTVGVATIFSSVGETVAKGRKLSELNQFAARIERVMREDFERMTRDGFLVIVNKNANFGEDVQLYRGEQTNIDQDLFPAYSGDPGRIRRSDEIMFFARGDFATQRRAVAPGMIATSSEAAIYYGHGQKRWPDLTAGTFDTDSNNLFFNPQPWDNNFDGTIDTRIGVTNNGLVNPNEFARDWSLLRHVTLLVNPEGRGQPLPSRLFGYSSSDRIQRPLLQDSSRQISLQPAARSIFTALSGTDLTGTVVDTPYWIYDAVDPNGLALPAYRVSGLVDIVTEDLSTIRNLIQSLPASPIDNEPEDYFNYAPSVPQPGGSNPLIVTRDDFDATYYDPAVQPRPADRNLLKLGARNPNGNWRMGATYWNPDHAERARKWMIDALPSRWDLSADPPYFVSGVRYEDIPTRIMYNETDFQSFGNDDEEAIARTFAEANQEMLGASVFIPRCTEFVVEWSYGFIDNAITDVTNPGYKQPIWYGLDRFVDADNDGELTQDDLLAARTYRQRSQNQAGTDIDSQRRFRGPDPELVVGRSVTNVGISTPDDYEIACFGFGTVPGGISGEAVEGGYWPWPKLIRITMTLGDPNDRDLEETYQVIFEVPEPE